MLFKVCVLCKYLNTNIDDGIIYGIDSFTFAVSRSSIKGIQHKLRISLYP